MDEACEAGHKAAMLLCIGLPTLTPDGAIKLNIMLGKYFCRSLKYSLCEVVCSDEYWGC